MKKVFRPFWTYRLQHTEDWLSRQSAEGWHLEDIHLLTRQFTLKQGQEQKKHYRITTIKKGADASSRLEQAGWSKAVSQKNWNVLEATEPTLYPVRDQLLFRNQIHFYITMTILFTYLLISIPSLMMDLLLSSGGMGSGGVGIQVGIFFGTLFLLVWMYTMYLENNELKKQEMQLEVTPGSSDQLKFKWRPLWFYDPLRTEHWLEEMAQQGFSLRRVHSLGFSFQKGTPHHRAYICDFNFRVRTSYYSVFKDFGWTLHHTSSLSFLNTTIWSMEYAEGEEKPTAGYEKSDRLKRLNKTYAMNFMWGIYFSFIMLYLFQMNFSQMPERNQGDPISGFLIGLLLLITLLWIVTVVRIAISYFRYRKTILGGDL